MIGGAVDVDLVDPVPPRRVARRWVDDVVVDRLAIEGPLGAAVVPVGPEVVVKFPEWLETLPASRFEFVATDFSPFRGSVDPNIPVITAPRALASAIGLIASVEYRHGRASDPAEVDANYVRRSDAELFWKE